VRSNGLDHQSIVSKISQPGARVVGVNE